MTKLKLPRRVMTVLVTTVLISAVALSPFGLLLVASRFRENWALLSNLSQSYEAAGALLTALAFLGVIGSLRLQRTATITAQNQALRTFHQELARMALDDPDYLECWRASSYTNSSSETKKFVYCNLLMSFWEMGYLVDRSEPSLRVALRYDFFPNPAPREYWKRVRHTRELSIRKANSRETEFFRIVDDEYHTAIETAKTTRVSRSAPAPRTETSTAVKLARAAAAAGLTYLVLRARSRPGSRAQPRAGAHDELR